MPIAPGAFAQSKLLDSVNNHRAYADVIVTDPAGANSSSVLQCLVDTGSDYTVLPISAAHAAGIIPAGRPVNFRTAGGQTYQLPSHPTTDLIIEGYSVNALVAFSTSTAFSPILGRLELVAAFDAAFDTAHWHWG